jgi:hypothetical protein
LIKYGKIALLKINPKANKMKSFNIKNLISCLLFSALNLCGVFAHAQNTQHTVVDPSTNTQYTLSYIRGTYAAISAQLDIQPWWQNSALAGRLIDQWRFKQGPNPMGLAAYETVSVNGTTFVSIAYPVGLGGGTYSSTLGSWDIEICPTDCPTVNSIGDYLIAVGYVANQVPIITLPNLSPNAYALRSAYNIQSASLNAGLSYDCNVFDKQGICLSTGGRYSTTNSPETTTTSGLLIGSYRYDKNIRLGAWVDQNLSTNNTDGIKLGNSKPLFGVFGAWAERPDGLGYEVKVSAGYGDKDLIVARTATNEGATNLNTTGIQTISSYGIAIAKDWIASPYVGVKYLSVKRAAYVEGGQDGLVYDSLRQETTSAVAGLSFKGKINSQTFTVLSAGVEHDLNHNVGEYSAKNSLFTVTSTAFNSKPQKTRPVVSAGIFYDIDKTQRLGLNAIHRQEAFQSTASTTALATYTVGF